MTQLQILAATDRERGEVFTDLVGDAFIARGYADVSRRVTHRGSELDLVAIDRREGRRAIAECKATKDPTGSGEVNKLVGKMALRDASETGYVVSLNGFTAPALEQQRAREELARSLEAAQRSRRFAGEEDARERERARAAAANVHLLDGSDVVTLAIDAHLAVRVDVATEAAGRWSRGEARSTEPRLLGHRGGWAWLCVFERCFVVIGGDGRPLNVHAARRLVELDDNLREELADLACVGPLPTADAELALEGLLAASVEEASIVTFEGLPADGHVAASAPRLKELVVPLDLISEPVTGADQQGGPVPERRVAVGTVIRNRRCVAILGDPGAGKTTLLRSLLIHYGARWGAGESAETAPISAFGGVNELPNRRWMPFLLQCRDLRRPNQAVLQSMCEEVQTVASSSAELVADALRAHLELGELLLLVDGLDEIGDAGERAAFVRQLRRFAGLYRRAAIIVTARHTGFEVVAPMLVGTSANYRLAGLSDHGITDLVTRWSITVDRTIRPSEGWALLENSRLRELARNPLLLTTLLLVRRWLGRLPQNRAALYAKAIEVLLMTWNVEAHEPIPEDEALPQLAYVAAAMVEGGDSRLNRTRLVTLLTEARLKVPHVFGYGSETPGAFIERVELRSSLLVHVGVERNEARLEHVFEFRHKTFQEYLTATAFVHNYHSCPLPDHDLWACLRPHVDDPAWTEVIPLAAVQAGRDAQPLLEGLMEAASDSQATSHVRRRRLDLLLACLADDVPVQPDWVPSLVNGLAYGRSWSWAQDGQIARQLVTARFGSALVETAMKFLKAGSGWGESLADMLAVLIAAQQTARTHDESFPSDVIRGADGLLLSDDENARMEAALLITAATAIDPSAGKEFLNAPRLVPDIAGSSPTITYAAARALAAVAGIGGLQAEVAREITRITRELLDCGLPGEAGRMVGRLRLAAGSQPVVPVSPEPYLGIPVRAMNFGPGSDPDDWILRSAVVGVDA